jgi:hypothetical protein
MARPTNKTPIEIAMELQAKADRAKARAAKEMASDNPQMEKLATVLASYNKEIAANSRKLEGPQSFDNRRKGIALRAAWIEAENAMVVAEDLLARERKQYLNDEMNLLAVRIAAGETVTDSEVDAILNDVPHRDISELILACSNAEAAWRDHTAAVKAKGGKNETVNEASAD